MAEKDNKRNYVRISGDTMNAYVYLTDPGEGFSYSIRDIVTLLNNNGVTMGIDEDAIDYLLDNQLYYREVKVAMGEPACDGTDGYYEYRFNRVIDKKPDAKADGTIDYWSISSIENVKKNQIIAQYKPAVQGISGYNVKGKSLMPKRARELPPLKGKGFERLEDGVTYISSMDGKIEFSNDRIVISEIYEIMGDADISIGNIDFAGDVVIYGKVCEGLHIKIGGNLTVNGTVEACVIEAGKDIIFRSGMLGGYKASVKAGGNIIAKFIENTQVTAGGEIQTDVLMNSNVISCEKLILTGKQGAIIGGKIHALRGVDAKRIGNESEVPTEISAGILPEVYVKREVLKKKIEKNQINIQRIDAGIKQFDELIAKDPRIKKDDPRKAQLIRAKIQDSVLLGQDRAELARLESLIERGGNAYIRASQYIYPRVSISIADRTIIIRSKELATEFIYREADIVKLDISFNT